MTTILSKLEAHPQQATEAQVETLAHAMYEAGSTVKRGDLTYFRILLTATQAKLGSARKGPGRRPTVDSKAQLAALEATHGRLYAAVLRGVTTADVADEPTLDAPEARRRALVRNARSGFARTAKSTLAAYAAAGSDLRGLDPAEVSKASVRAALAPPEPTDRVARQVSRAEGALIRALTRQARASPDTAAGEVERVMQELQKILDDLGAEPEDHGATTTVVGRPAHARTRVGVPVMVHRPAGAP